MSFEAEQLARVLRHYIEDGGLKVPAVVEHSLGALETRIEEQKTLDAATISEDQKAAARELQRIARLAQGSVVVAPIEAFRKCFDSGTVKP